jgi:adenine-specific DNA-methyltransferase
MNEKQEKLIKLLEEMFQLNQTDLDFGIYRIMNQKADEIKQFLQKDLMASIKNAFAQNSNDGLQKELDSLMATITNAGMNPDDSPKVKELKEKLLTSSNNESNENEIYSYLTNFFSRYYKDGDFVSLRRYKKDTYAIPYEGEEVKLHWANSDQYYIKTSEFFRDYSFVVAGKKYHFKIVDADTEKNNNKASNESERRFVLDKDHPIMCENGELFIRFEYKSTGKEPQSRLNEKAIETILKEQNPLVEMLRTLSPTEKNKTRTILEKHLNDYTSRNSFDYFIHKDLKGFLSRELDFFIKNEILYIDDILDVSSSAIEASMNKIKTFKSIAQKVIAFLSQIEDFQKKLWLKKKFVIGAEYCITLDKIAEIYHEEIFANEAQLQEWQTLFGSEALASQNLFENTGGTKVPLPYLVVDTKFFSQEFKDRLLGEFDDIDEQTDGVLINSENFGALNLLQERYKEQVKTVYIDPPYNTGNDFIYSDSYQHSSWLSFMQDRLILMKNFTDKSGRFFCSIDDRESNRLLELLYLHLDKDNYLGAITWEKRTKSQNTKTSKYMLQSKIEYIHPFRFNDKRQEFNLEVSGQKEYPEEDENGVYRIQKAEQDSLDRPHAAESMVYPILGIYPAKGKCWKFGEKTKNIWEEENRIFLKDNHPHIIFRPEHEEQDIHKPFWSHFFDKETYGTAESGLNLLDKQLGFGKDFQTVKPVPLITKLLFHTTDNEQIILDYFAGSGTTGHATINLNKEDGGKRKYILVEMGNYFDTVTKQRIQKVIYSDNWKDGKPQDKNGISQMFKYFRLESYEDTLNNLAFKSVDKDLFSDDVKEDYLLKYMLDYETNESLLGIDAFKTPFDYKLKIATSSAGETTETNVDLVETFNYLIGLKVKTRVKNRGFLVIVGENLKEEKILVIWRDGKTNDELNQFFSKMDFTVYDREFDTIYVNGDNNLANLKKDEEHFKVKLIEEEFKARMFGE